ncbi:MAG TPA: NAD(P)H-binding protein [Candidatus Methylomirabilis sp.]|nr:NAD(P)H-binding protein [Candidatus Methylomirabilis sp.]
MKIAITTPTGNIGRELTKRLLDRGGHELILLARSPDKLTREQLRGAKVVKGDLGDAVSLKKATQGADALFFLCPPSFTVPDYRAYDVGLAKNGAEAVKVNKVKHTVLLSSVGAHLSQGTGPILGLHDAEKIFAQVTKGLTILRPTWFMENHLWHLDEIKNMNSIFMPLSGNLTAPMIATGDIADRAARVITGPAPSQPNIVPLHGPKEYSLDECARIIGRAVGKEVKHVQVPPAKAKEAMIGMGASEAVADTILEMYAAFQAGTLKDEAKRSPETTTPTTFETFVKNVLVPALNA